MPNSISQFIEFLKKFWKPIASIIGAITTIVGFVELWKGNSTVIIWIIVIVGYVAAALSLAYIWYAYTPSPFDSKRKIYTYSDRVRKAAIIGFSFLLSAPIIFSLFSNYLTAQTRAKQDSFIVLLAKLNGDERLPYSINEMLLSDLRQLFNTNQDKVIYLDRAIKNKHDALTVGDKYHADVVLWGDIGDIEENNDINLSIDVEINTENGELLVETYVTHAYNAELQNSQVEATLAEKIAPIPLYIDGIRLFENEMTSEAISQFTAAIKQGDWSASDAIEASIYYYLGKSYLKSGNYNRALEDLTNALEINSQHALAYVARGDAYRNLKDTENAILDYSSALQINSQYDYAYYRRAIAYEELGDYENAAKDFQSVLELSDSDELRKNSENHLRLLGVIP